MEFSKKVKYIGREKKENGNKKQREQTKAKDKMAKLGQNLPMTINSPNKTN